MADEIIIRIGANTAAALVVAEPGTPQFSIALTMMRAKIRDALHDAGYAMPDPDPQPPGAAQAGRADG